MKWNPGPAEPICNPVEIPLLMNAKSGKFHSTPSVEEMRQTIRSLGYPMEVIGTSSKEHFLNEVSRLVAARAPCVAVAGGDGTLRLAVQKLACTQTCLGIVPQGTMNNFATALRLPQDLPSALRVINEGEAAHVDLGKCGDQFFIESAGVGLFANALSFYGSTNKNLFRGLYAIVRLLLDFHARRLKLNIDGQTKTERAVLCVAANTYRIAQAFPIAPGAKLTDGKLDVVILGDLTRGEIIPYLNAVRRQTHYMLPKVENTRATSITIEAFRRLPVHVDDEACFETPVQIEVVPKGLKVLVERL